MTDDPIAAREAELREAMLSNDVAALDELVDDELVFTTIEGAIVGKQDDLESHRLRRLKLSRLDPSEQRIIQCGSCAVVSVRMRVEGTWDGVAADAVLRYTRVWRLRADRWRVVACHVSVVRE